MPLSLNAEKGDWDREQFYADYEVLKQERIKTVRVDVQLMRDIEPMKQKFKSIHRGFFLCITGKMFRVLRS